jgi:hypothetical protein
MVSSWFDGVLSVVLTTIPPGRFDELKGLSVNTTEKKALAVLKKAQQLVKLGLEDVCDCFFAVDSPRSCEITFFE